MASNFSILTRVNAFRLPWKKLPKNLDFFCNFKKLPKVNNRPIGDNSPNPANLLDTFATVALSFVDSQLSDSQNVDTTYS
jgi:hypothetical protein